MGYLMPFTFYQARHQTIPLVVVCSTTSISPSLIACLNSSKARGFRQNSYPLTLFRPINFRRRWCCGCCNIYINTIECGKVIILFVEGVLNPYHKLICPSLPTNAFQTCWKCIKKLSWGVFHEFDENGRFEKSLNATFICHPKKIWHIGGKR